MPLYPASALGLVAVFIGISGQSEGAESTLEEIVVTGTRLAHDTFSAPSPIQVIGREEFRAAGQPTMDDLIRDLTINSGSNILGGIGDGGPSARGRSQFNLRGLRPEATLVLLNGQRMPLTLDNFVDVNTIPMNAVERIEIVKESGSAVYGSDAVAGVVNFITRSPFEGLELDVNYQSGADGSQEDKTYAAAFGIQGERGHASVFIEYMDRSELYAIERDFFEDHVSADAPFGAAFNVVGRNEFLALSGPAAGQFVYGPACIDSLGIPTGPNAATLRGSSDPIEQAVGNTLPDGAGLGFCGVNTELGPFGPREGPQEQIVPEQRRANFLVDTAVSLPGLAQALNVAEVEAHAELNFAYLQNRTVVNDIPVIFSVSGPGFGEDLDLVIPAELDDPSTPEVEDLNPFDFPVATFGRQLYTRLPVEKDIWNARFHGGLDADFSWIGRDDWQLGVDLVYGRDYREEQLPGILIDRFDRALEGRGGPGRNLVFNPFVPDPVVGSDAEVIDDFLATDPYTNETRLTVLGGDVSGTAFELPAGPVRIALGAEYQRDELRENDGAASDSQNVVLLGGDKSFPELAVVGGSGGTRLKDFIQRDVWAAFAEVALPIHRTLDLQAAVRYSDYGSDEPIGDDGIGDTTDPHFALNWRPLGLNAESLEHHLRVRATYGTAFRAPSVDKSNPGESFETGSETLLNPFQNPDGSAAAGCSGSASVTVNRAESNRLTGPEDAENFSFGLTSEIGSWSLSADFQHIEIKDAIGSREAQDVLNTACDAVNGDLQALIEDPVLAESLGVRVQPGLGIVRVEEQFVNAARLEQDAVDMAVRHEWPTDRFGIFTTRLNATYITDYTLIRVDGRKIDVNGNTNDGTILGDIVDLRANASLEWALGGHTLTGIVRYLNGFDDIRRGETPADDVRLESIGSHTEVDLQYRYRFERLFDGAEIAVGAINLFDRDPPAAPNEPRNFVREIHDARGRLLYARMTFSF